jgi:hypothetical protein
MWLTNLFKAAPKAVGDVLDKDSGLLTQFGGWIGDMNLTDEEVIKYNAKTIGDVQEFVKATLSESTERSRTRRSIAGMWIKVHLSVILLFCIATPWNHDVAAQYLALATSGTMGGITGAISIFFFGSQGLARHNESRNKK